MSYRVFFRTISKQYMFVLESMQGAIMSAASLQQCLPQACGKYSQQAHFFGKGARINIQWSLDFQWKFLLCLYSQLRIF